MYLMLIELVFYILRCYIPIIEDYIFRSFKCLSIQIYSLLKYKNVILYT